MSQSPTASDDFDFYAEDGEGQVDNHTQHDRQVPHNLDTSDDYAPVSPASEDMQMDESPPPSPQRVANKRKLGSHYHDGEQAAVRKKQRVIATPEQYYTSVLPRTAGLPAEIWQHIFLHFNPDTLSCCLRVNRAFRAYLTSTSASQGVRLPPRRTGLKLLDSDSIWTSSRKLFVPNLPRPLAGFSEMEMFQLLGGRYCQLCGKPPSGILHPRSPFDAGPANHGLRVIWSFGARMCGHCFEMTSLKVCPNMFLVSLYAHAKA